MTASPGFFRPDILSGVSVRVERCDGRFGIELAASLKALGAAVTLDGRDPVAIEEQRAGWAAGLRGIRGDPDVLDRAPSSADALIRMFSRATISPNVAAAAGLSGPRAGAAISMGSTADMARRLRAADASQPEIAIWVLVDAAGERLDEAKRLLADIQPRRAYAMGRTTLRPGWNAALSESDLPAPASVASIAAQLLAKGGRDIANRYFQLPDEEAIFDIWDGLPCGEAPLP